MNPYGRPRKAILQKAIPPKNGDYFTVAEASAILGLHKHTIQARLRDGTIQGKLIGRTWRIYKEELYHPVNDQ